jgi:hypothetical protein
VATAAAGEFLRQAAHSPQLIKKGRTDPLPVIRADSELA